MSRDFGGTSQWLKSPALTVGSQMSVGAWFDPDVLPVFTDTAPFMGHGGRVYILWDATGPPGTPRLNLHVQDGRWTTTPVFAALTGWKWMLLTHTFTLGTTPTVYTWERGVFRTYTVANGGLIQSHAYTVDSAADGDVVEFGYSHVFLGPNSWDGRIGEAALWTRVLSPGAASAVCVRGPLVEPGAALYWPLDGGEYKDYSGHGRDAVEGSGVGVSTVGPNAPSYPAGLALAGRIAA